MTAPFSGGVRPICLVVVALGINSFSSSGFVTQAKPSQPHGPQLPPSPKWEGWSPSLRRVFTLSAGKEHGKVKPFLICGDSICSIPVFPVYLAVITWGFSEKYQMFEVAPHNLNCILNTYKPQKDEQEELGVECWLEKRRNAYTHLIMEFQVSNLTPFLLKPRTAIDKLCLFIHGASLWATVKALSFCNVWLCCKLFSYSCITFFFLTKRTLLRKKFKSS